MSPKNACITIYTDASVDAGVGGWAAWVKRGPGDSALFSGAFKTPVYSSTTAELRAIANGLTHAIRMRRGGAIFVVVTDSQAAMDFVNGKVMHSKKPKRKNQKDDETFARKMKRYKSAEDQRQIAAKIRDMVPADCELRVNKVKAHSKADGKRSYVNNLVDKACRKAMRAARDEARPQPEKTSPPVAAEAQHANS